MPTYEYRCTACGHEFDEYQSMTAKPLTKCPSCGKKALKRLIGIGAAIVFKGSGFYQTDYRSESYKKAAEAESKSPSTSETKSDAKAPESASSAKPSDAGPATPKLTENSRPSNSASDSKGAKNSDAKSSESSKPQASSQSKPGTTSPAEPKATSRSVTGGRAGRGKGNVTPRKPKRR